MRTQKSKWAVREPSKSAESGERPALSYHQDPSFDSELEHAGFSGSCDNTSLADWIQLVQMGRRDAIVSIRAHDGRMGRLWCRDGDIIDALCDGIVGEDAVYQALSWQGGKVSVDFRRFERQRQIPVATAALLLEAAYRKDSGVRELGAVRAPASSPPPTPASSLEGGTTSLPSLEAEQKARPRSLGVLVAFGVGVLGVILLLAFVVSRWVSPPEEAAARASVPEFLVHLEVVPAHAEISLDGEVMAVGRLSKVLPADGKMHEIRTSAPNYISERLVFQNTPFRKTVALTPSFGGPSAEKLADAALEADRVRVAPPRSDRAHNASTRPQVVSAPVRRSNPVSNNGARAERPRDIDKATTVEIIEDRRPRVQVIDENKPRIEAIE